MALSSVILATNILLNSEQDARDEWATAPTPVRVAAYDESLSATAPTDRGPTSTLASGGSVGVDLPRPRTLVIRTMPRPRMIPLQRWEGFVEEINDKEGTFEARLADLEPGATGDPEFAEFSLDEVSSDDRELVKPGAIFQWIVGYRDQTFGQRERVSQLVFRRLPAWTTGDLAKVKSEAEALANALRWG